MGLDIVELVMDVEDHFGISIRDAEAQHIRTVGDLVSLIQSRIEAAHLATCPTLSSFLCLRTCAREITSNGQLRMRTKTRVVDVLLPTQRRQLWKRLEGILGTPPPALRRPPFLRKALVGTVFVLIILAMACASAIDWAILPLTLALAALVAFVTHFTTVRFRTYPPVELATFGSVAKRIAGSRVATERLHLRTFDAILADLRPIVVDALGVDENEVVAEARFVEDLGCD